MNVLIVATDFPPSTGGISTYVSELAPALSRHCRVTVLAPGAPRSRDHDRNCEYRIIRTPSLPVLRALAFFVYLPFVLRWRHIDSVLHTTWPTALVSHIWYMLFPIPYFVTVHASEIMDDSLSLRRRLKGILRPWRYAALRHAKSIFPVSRYTAGLVRDQGVAPERIRVITLGVNTDRFRPPANRVEHDGPRRLLTVARLDLHKGHDRVLEALGLLKQRGISVHYTIAGKGEEEVRLRRMAEELHLDEQVRFAGFVPDDDLPDLYAAADIFIMASREIPGRVDLIEGFGLTFLEASACGLPVIAGRSGGVPDAVRDGETGYLVDPDNPEEIARVIAGLAADRKLADRLGRTGRQWVETEMNWQAVAKRVFEAMSARTNEKGGRR